MGKNGLFLQVFPSFSVARFVKTNHFGRRKRKLPGKYSTLEEISADVRNPAHLKSGSSWKRWHPKPENHPLRHLVFFSSYEKRTFCFFLGGVWLSGEGFIYSSCSIGGGCKHFCVDVKPFLGRCWCFRLTFLQRFWNNHGIGNIRWSLSKNSTINFSIIWMTEVQSGQPEVKTPNCGRSVFQQSYHEILCKKTSKATW